MLPRNGGAIPRLDAMSAARPATAPRSAALAVLAVLAVPAVFAACGNSGDDNTPVPSLSDAFAESGLTATTAAGTGATVTGVVVDAAGAPLANVPVSMCATACWPGVTDDNGRFRFADLPVEHYAVDVRGDRLAGRLLISTIFPWDVVPGTQSLAAPVRLHVPVMPEGWDGAQPLRVAGLQLTPTQPIDVGELQRLTGDAAIGAALIPPEDWPNYKLTRDGRAYEPLLMWALRPFGHVLGAPLQVGVDEKLLRRFDSNTALFHVDVVTGLPRQLSSRTVEVVSWVILASPARSR